MDFMNRSTNQPAAPARPAASTSASAGSARKSGGSWKDNPIWLRVVWVVLLFSGTVLISALAALMYFGGPSESNFIDTKKQQAVFLTNGQVYFGKINTVNKHFVDLRKIYYLNVNQQVQPTQDNNKDSKSNISLVKLGCELHGPVDQMIINRSQVSFWENLKDDGQVAKAIATWVQQNPNGQNCQTAASTNTTESKQP